jgi:tRNA pseudouridine(55) synthase
MNNIQSYDGVIILDKPKGLSSFKAVEKLRKTLGVKKAGHTGTLDPLATGVLPVCLGEATKISSFIMGQDKVYYVRAKLGERTDTLDSDGKITAVKEVPRSLDKKKIMEVLENFKGEVEQIPPMYSAIKKDGVPLYKMAFKGITQEREARKVTINEISLTEILLPYFDLVVSCSKGTYIRTLIDDIGEKLDTYAHVTELRRLANGVFDIKDAVDINSLMGTKIETDMQIRDGVKKISKKLISLEAVVTMIMPIVEVDLERARCIARGTSDCLEGLWEKVDHKQTYGTLNYGILSKSKDLKKLVAIANADKILRVFNYSLWV